jgi:hypothetical protein
VLKDGSAIIGESEGAVPLGPRGKNKNIVVDAFIRGENNGATSRLSFFAPFNRSDTANLDGAIVVDKKIVIRDEHVILEFTLSGGSHTNGGREMKRERAGGYEGEVCCDGVDLGGEDASNGCARCTTTDDNDALAASPGHCIR